MSAEHKTVSLIQKAPRRFNVGDMCALKSGGELMTVQDIGPDGSILCVWHDQVGNPQEDTYSEVVLLTKAEVDEKNQTPLPRD